MEDSTSIDALMGGNGGFGGGPGPNSGPEMLPSMDIRDNIPSMDLPMQMPMNPMQMNNQFAGSGGNMMGGNNMPGMGSGPGMPQNTSHTGMHHMAGGNMPGMFAGLAQPQKRNAPPPKKSFMDRMFDKRSLTEMAYIVVLFFIFNMGMLHRQVYRFVPQLFSGGSLSKVGVILYGIVLALVYMAIKKLTL